MGALSILMLSGPLGMSACGRSAPPDALSDTAGDPDIAGVFITSPDAVVETMPAPGTSVSTEPAAPEKPQTLYTVQPGDTLSGIADQFGVSTRELAAANGIGDLNDLSPGQELAIPIPAPVEVSVVDASEISTPDQPTDSTTGDSSQP